MKYNTTKNSITGNGNLGISSSYRALWFRAEDIDTISKVVCVGNSAGNIQIAFYSSDADINSSTLLKKINYNFINEPSVLHNIDIPDGCVTVIVATLYANINDIVFNGLPKDYIQELDETKRYIADRKPIIDDIFDEITVTNAGNVPFKFRNGKKYFITNNGSEQVSVRLFESGSIVQNVYVSAGKSTMLLCNADASYINVYVGAGIPINVTCRRMDSYNYRIDNITSRVNAYDSVVNSLCVPKPKGMYAIAHMGYVENAPRNSILAYENACKKGAFAVNTAQVRKSANGTLWIMHDDDTANTTNSASKGLESTLIGEMQDSDIEELLINANESIYTDEQRRVPKLFDVLKLCSKYGTIPMIRTSMGGSGSMSDTLDSSWQSIFDHIKYFGLEQSVMFSGSVKQLYFIDAYFPNAPKIFHSPTSTLSKFISTLDGYDWKIKSTVYAMPTHDKLNKDDIMGLRKAGYRLMDAGLTYSEQFVREAADYGCDFINVDFYQGLKDGILIPTNQQILYEMSLLHS